MEAEIQTDVEILLECVKCQRSQPDSLKSSLATLASVLTANDAAKESFRDLGGLKYIFNLITSTENLPVRQTGMFCLACAVEKSVFSQKSLSQQSTFVFVHKILSDISSSSKIKQTAVFFLLCLVANNGLGQNLARQTGCLADLMEMCKALIKDNQSDLTTNNSWIFVNSAINVCVNNPQNEENQHLTSMLFPHLLKLFQETLNLEVLKPALSLMGLAVANNFLNQDRVRRCDGLNTLIRALGKCMGYSVLDEPSLAIPIISTLDSCIADHEVNCKKFSELGGISLLLEILRQPDLDQQEKLQVVLTLGHALDTSAENQNCIDKKGYQTLVKHLTEAQDEELIKALKYTLNLCQKEGQMNDSVENTERQQGEIILEKITELTAKLNSFEEESRHDSKLLSDFVGYQNKKTKIDEHSNIHLSEEKKIVEEKPEQPPLSRTESFLQQLVNMLQFSQTQQKTYNSSFDVNENWQTDQFTPVKAIQTDKQYPNIPTDKQGSLSSRYVDKSTENEFVGSITKYVSSNLHSESEQRKCGYIKDFEIPQKSQSLISKPDLLSQQNYIHHKDDDDDNHRCSEVVHQGIHDKNQVLDRPNWSNNAPVTTVCLMEGNSKNCHMQHHNNSYDIGTHASQSQRNNNSSGSKVNGPTGIHSDMHNQDRGSTNNMLDGHIVNADEIAIHDRMQNQNVSSSINAETCNCGNNQFCNCSNKETSNVSYSSNGDLCKYFSCGNCCNFDVNKNVGDTHDGCDREKAEGQLQPSEKHVGPSHNKIQCRHSNANLQKQDMDAQQGRFKYIAQYKDSRSNGQNQLQCEHFTQHVQNDEVKSNNMNKTQYKYSRHYTQNGITKSKNQHSSCEIIAVKAVTDNDGNRISRKPCLSVETHNQTVESRKTSNDLVNNLHTDHFSDDDNDDVDDVNQCEHQKTVLQNASEVFHSNRGCNTPVQRHTSDSLVKERRHGNGLNYQTNTETNLSSNYSESHKIHLLTSDMFVKPVAIPLRRKINTPSCGSGTSIGSRRSNVRVFSKKPMVGIQVKPIAMDEAIGKKCFVNSPFIQKQQTVEIPPSPTPSEFDFGLLASAKRNLWKSKDLNKSCTPVDLNLSVKPFRSYTDVRRIRKPTVNPSYSRPISEVCLKHSDSDSVFSEESDDTSQTSTVDSEVNSQYTANRLQIADKNNHCPGCSSSKQIGGTILNSRTFNIALETSSDTCSHHRNIRRVERNYIQKIKARCAVLTASEKKRPLRINMKPWICKQEMNAQSQKIKNVYDFHGSSSDSDPVTKNVSPPHTTQSSVHPLQHLRNKDAKRRKRIPYSEEELEFLKHGIEHFGKRWNQILVTYKFNPSRTSIDLMEKHKRLMAKKNKNSTDAKRSNSFSMCEERRLIRGVKIFGYHWKGILQAFKFSKDRTADDLRNKWRRMNKHLC